MGIQPRRILAHDSRRRRVTLGLQVPCPLFRSTGVIRREIHTERNADSRDSCVACDRQRATNRQCRLMGEKAKALPPGWWWPDNPSTGVKVYLRAHYEFDPNSIRTD